MKKVSIIMATYNRAHFILNSLESIKNQTHTNWECLIIDDGGSDNTSEVILPLLEKDSRFNYLKRTEGYKKGLPGCRNYGLDIATGDFIIFFDDDDIVHRENLETCIGVLADSKYDFCHYQKRPFVNDLPIMDSIPVTLKRNISMNNIEDVITGKIGFASCTVMWKPECFVKNRFDETLLYAEEWECYIRILMQDFEGVEIENELYYNRKHLQSNTGEFLHNPIRRKSKADAVLLILNRLNENAILTNSILRYFIQISLSFKEFTLFQAILNELNLKGYEKRRWQLFYFILPMKLQLYKLKKRWLRKY